MNGQGFKSLLSFIFFLLTSSIRFNDTLTFTANRMVNSMLKNLNIEFVRWEIKGRDLKNLNVHIDDVLIGFKPLQSNRLSFSENLSN